MDFLRLFALRNVRQACLLLLVSAVPAIAQDAGTTQPADPDASSIVPLFAGEPVPEQPELAAAGSGPAAISANSSPPAEDIPPHAPVDPDLGLALEPELAALGPGDGLMSDLPGDPGVAAVEGELVPVSVPPAPTPTESVVINLINRLVERGVLTKQDAAELISQAEADAEIARQEAAATQEALVQVAVTQAVASQTAPPPTDDAVRVTYVPEVVKKQIRNQIRDEVLAQAREENWAAPNLLPDWLGNVHPFADLRFRFEADLFPSGNDATGAFPNFNAINTGPPFDVTGDQFSPQLNVDQNRYRFRIRARFGAGLDLGENFSAGLRIATGDSNSPTSTNQTVGLPYDGQGGNFSKYAIWLDRAFLSYTLGSERNKKLGLFVGRFDNPFFTASSIVWDDDIGFDGLALVTRYEIVDGFTPFLVGGAFPVFNTDFNFSSNQPVKFQSYDKYLFGAQLGAEWDVYKDLELTAATAYYYFYNIEGKLSDPFVPLSPSDAGNTDASRPSFAQKGNTYMALRNIIPTEANNFGTTDQYQYYGLATPFRVLAVSTRLDYTRFEPFTISLLGEYVNNLAFSSGDINAKAVNNRGANDDDLSDSVGSFAGTNTAWSIQLQVGAPEIAKRWDWNIGFGYRWVGSDAVVDGFTDSDFGGGGTNLKGYIIGGNLALSSNVWLGIRWMSAESIAGPTFQQDIFQFDINARF